MSDETTGDLTSVEQIAGEALGEAQIHGILSQIDLDITNLLRDGKLSASKIVVGEGGLSVDRAANLKALLEARGYYESKLRELPGWEISLFQN